MTAKAVRSTDPPDFQVIVIGGGVAGLSAGVRAAELGLKTAVLEKGASAQYLCNSRISGGNFHIALHNAKLPKDELLAAIRTRTDGTADPALAETLSERAGATIDWLLGLGVKFIRTGPLDPPRTTRKFKAMPVETPPFYAIPVCAGITYTMGGIKIDGNARVLDGNGAPITGVYAAGSATGGLEGVTERAFYVGGLCRASVFGKRAAEHIAENTGHPRRSA